MNAALAALARGREDGYYHRNGGRLYCADTLRSRIQLQLTIVKRGLKFRYSSSRIFMRLESAKGGKEEKLSFVLVLVAIDHQPVTNGLLAEEERCDGGGECSV